MKEIQIAAGCKTRIIRRQFSSLAMTYTLDAVPMIQNDDLAGTVEIKGSDWIFPYVLPDRHTEGSQSLGERHSKPPNLRAWGPEQPEAT